MIDLIELVLAQGHGLGMAGRLVVQIFILDEVFNDLESISLLKQFRFLVRRLLSVLLFVDALALTTQTLFVLLLLVVDVFLEAAVHLQGRVEPILDCVVGPASHVLRYQ